MLWISLREASNCVEAEPFIMFMICAVSLCLQVPPLGNKSKWVACIDICLPSSMTVGSWLGCRFEQELRDTAAFDRWRADAMASDRAARAEEIRLRIIEMAEAQDAAIRARQAKIQEHLKLGHCVKV